MSNDPHRLFLQAFHESLRSLLLWLDHAERRSRPASLSQPNAPLGALQQHRDTLIVSPHQLLGNAPVPAQMRHPRVFQNLREELRQRRAQQASLQLLWSQLQPEEAAEDSREAPEKLRATGSKLKLLLRQVEGDLGALQRRLLSAGTAAASVPPAEAQIQEVALCPQGWEPEGSGGAGVCPEDVSSTQRSELLQTRSDRCSLHTNVLSALCCAERRAAPAPRPRSSTGCSALLFRCTSSCCSCCCSPA